MVAVVRTTVVAAVVAAAVIFGVSSAGAGPNLVPNGSFTDGCPVPSPCHWSADTANTTIGQSLVNFHTAPASLRMDVGSVSSAGALSDCFAIAPSTQYTIQGWYSTQSTALGGLGVELFEFADGACTVIADEAAAGAFPIVTTGASNGYSPFPRPLSRISRAVRGCGRPGAGSTGARSSSWTGRRSS